MGKIKLGIMEILLETLNHIRHDVIK